MLTEATLPVSWRAKPRSFVALMGLYESNYLRLLRLCGDPQVLPAVRLALVEGDCPLQLMVAARTPYTTELDLTYLMPDTDERLPDLRVKLYSDARMAEALSCANQPLHPALRALHLATAAEQFDQRWRLNVLLNKWLEYLLDRGYQLS
jgi:uncharacterized protein YqiB (DUF1249 family)